MFVPEGVSHSFYGFGQFNALFHQIQFGPGMVVASPMWSRGRWLLALVGGSRPLFGPCWVASHHHLHVYGIWMWALWCRSVGFGFPGGVRWSQVLVLPCCCSRPGSFIHTISPQQECRTLWVHLWSLCVHSQIIVFARLKHSTVMVLDLSWVLSPQSWVRVEHRLLCALAVTDTHLVFSLVFAVDHVGVWF